MNTTNSNLSATPCDQHRRRACVTAAGLLAAVLLGGCRSNPPARPVASRSRPEPARKPDPKGPDYDGYLK